jgi:hypothetical protein
MVDARICGWVAKLSCMLEVYVIYHAELFVCFECV